MAAGRVVFDGAPEDLTTEVARELYGADGLEEAFSESMTSTSLEAIPARRRSPALGSAAPVAALN